jgi:hypothetical protein
VLGALKGQETSWEGVHRPRGKRLPQGEWADEGAQIPEGERKAMRGKNWPVDGQGGHGQKYAKVHIQRA